MGQRETSIVRQRRLRAELRRLREASGRTQKAVADALGWSTSKVIRIETGAVKVSTSDVMALLHYYGIHDAERVNHLLAATRALREGWWTEYRSGLFSEQFLEYLSYEDSAIRIMQYMHHVVPGLLQTEEYAKVLIDYFGQADLERADRGARVRMRRQELLDRPVCPNLLFVLDEAIIHRWVGGPVVMLRQLDRLKTLAHHPSVSIRIVPFTEGLHAGLRGSSFTVFELPSHEHVVILEDPRGDMIVDEPETSSSYIEAFLALQQLACLEWETDNLIDPVIERLRPGTMA